MDSSPARDFVTDCRRRRSAPPENERSWVLWHHVENTTDPEATFRRTAGENNIGYSANLVEDVIVDEDGKVTGSLITDYDL